MLRRFLVVAAACGALLGLSASPLAAPAKADVTQVYLPVRTGLAHVCLIIHSADAGVCVHV
jgi:hypothetical protein